MTTVPPGGSGRVRFDELPLIALDQDGASANPDTRVAPPGGTALVRFDVVPPLSFDFPDQDGGGRGPALDAAPPVRPRVPTAGSGRNLAATGWTPPGAAVLALGIGWVLRRRLLAGEGG